MGDIKKSSCNGWNFEGHPFLWIFRLGKGDILRTSLDPGTKPTTHAAAYELRYFFEQDTPHVLVPAFDPRMYDTAHFRQKHHDDLYYVTPDERLNFKVRNDSLQIKEQVYEESGICGFLKKRELDFISPTGVTGTSIEAIEALLRRVGFRPQDGALLNVRKESMRFKSKEFLEVSIEFSRLCVGNQIFYALCLEGKNLAEIRWLARGFQFKAPPLSYTAFLKRFIP